MNKGMHMMRRMTYTSGLTSNKTKFAALEEISVAVNQTSVHHRSEEAAGADGAREPLSSKSLPIYLSLWPH